MKKTITTIILALVFINVNAQTPNWAWAKSAGGTGPDRTSSSATDAYGNVYVSGHFDSPSITFGSFTLINSGSWDIFIVKYDPLGNILWAKGIGNSSGDYTTGISTDGSGNVYITGYFRSQSIAFGTTTLNNSSIGFEDIFIAKFDSLGNALWAKSAGNTDNDKGYGIVCDSSGNVCITGYYKSSITFDGTTLTNSGYEDIYVVKYDNSGNIIWAKKAGGSNDDRVLSIATDNSNNVYITGYYYSTIFNLGTLTLNNSGFNDVFIAKIDAFGNPVWLNNFGSTQGECGQGITTDATGNVYVIGFTNSLIITAASDSLVNSGTTDLFLVKYDSLGNPIWIRSAQGTGYDYGMSAVCDQNGNVFVTGHHTSAALTFGTFTLNNGPIGGNTSMFIAKYDAAGNVIWAHGGNSGSNSGYNVSTDNLGNIYLAGAHNGNITFGTTTLSSLGDYDMFIAKIENDIVNIEINDFKNGTTIYPNPTSGTFTIQNSSLKLQSCSIKNMVGECLFSQQSNLTNQINIDLSTHAKGIYFVEIFDENNSRINKKVIIE